MCEKVLVKRCSFHWKCGRRRFKSCRNIFFSKSSRLTTWHMHILFLFYRKKSSFDFSPRNPLCSTGETNKPKKHMMFQRHKGHIRRQNLKSDLKFKSHSIQIWKVRVGPIQSLGYGYNFSKPPPCVVCASLLCWVKVTLLLKRKVLSVCL